MDEEISPGPRVVMTKAVEQYHETLVRFCTDNDSDQEQAYILKSRWEQLGEPQQIEVRLEGA